MKPYKIIEGDNHPLEAFEQKVAAALEEGYSLAGELTVLLAGGVIKLYQPLILEDDQDFDEEDEDEEEAA